MINSALMTKLEKRVKTDRITKMTTLAKVVKKEKWTKVTRITGSTKMKRASNEKKRARRMKMTLIMRVKKMKNLSKSDILRHNRASVGDRTEIVKGGTGGEYRDRTGTVKR